MLDWSIREREIYLDNAATTVIAPEVVEAMTPYLKEKYGNPETPYHLGYEAKEAVAKIRHQIAAAIGAKDEQIYFTSGGTESNNWVIKDFNYCDKAVLVVGAIEHSSVLESAFSMEKHRRIITCPVEKKTGKISFEALENILNTETEGGLVSIQYANNEIGTIHPIREISELCHKNGFSYHCDACQALGKTPIDVEALGVDMMSLSAHKIHGPMGIGALYLRNKFSLYPLLHGGGQENGMRSGTLAVHQIVGFGVAVEMAMDFLSTNIQKMESLSKRLEGDLRTYYKAERNGCPESRLPNIVNVTIPNVEAALVCGILAAKFGICLSMCSACETKNKSSHVLKAIGKDFQNTIRISLSRYTTTSDIVLFLALLQRVIAEIGRKEYI